MIASLINPTEGLSPAILAAMALGYVCYFYGVAFIRPWVPLLLIMMSAPFTNDISVGGGLHFSLTEVNLLLATPLLFLHHRRLTFGPAVWPVLLYIALCIGVSVLHWTDLATPPPSLDWGDFLIYRKGGDALTAILQMGIYLILTVALFASLPRRVEDYRPVLHGYLAVCLILALTVVVLHTGRVLGLHKNAVGGSLSAAFIISLELGLSETKRGRRLRYLVLAGLFAIGCLGTLSRGSWIAASVGVIILFTLRRQFGMLLKLGLLVVPLVAGAWLLLPDEQKEYATGFGAERYNIKQRYVSVQIAEWYFKRSPIIGNGVSLRKEYDATNLALLTLAETGVVGAACLSLVFLTVFGLVWRTQRGLPRDHIAFSVVAICGAIFFGRVAHGMVDHYWGRGGPTVASWAGVGMVVHVAQVLRRHRRALRQQSLHSPVAPPTPALPEGVPA